MKASTENKPCAAINLAYIALSVSVFAISFTVGACRSAKGFLSPKPLQLSFAAHAVFTTAFLLVVFKVFRVRKVFNVFKSREVGSAAADSAAKAAVPFDIFGTMTTVVVVTGILLRACYMLFTSAGTRTYDVYRES